MIRLAPPSEEDQKTGRPRGDPGWGNRMIRRARSFSGIEAYRFVASQIRASRLLNVRVAGNSLRVLLPRAAWLLLRLSIENPLHAEGHLLFHNKQPYVLSIVSGMHEPETTRYLRTYLRPGMTFVDVGAHVGWHTLAATKSILPDGRVFAFEPLPSALALLRKNIAANGYATAATPIGVAITDHLGDIQLHEDGQDSVMTSLHRSDGRVYKIPCTSLDFFFSALGWPPVDLIKIDVEGGEIDVLRGMGELVQRNPRVKLIIEYAPTNLTAAHVTSGDFFQALINHGFTRISAITRGRFLPIACLEDLLRLPKKLDYYENLLCEQVDDH